MTQSDDRRFNEDYAVYFAMVKAGHKRKATMSPVEFARRRALEAIAQQRRYCDGLALWRNCRRDDCRRHGRCGGDAHICLKRALGRVPQDVQRRIRQDILDSAPVNIGAPERAARQMMPRDFYE